MVSLIKPGLKEGHYITWAHKWTNSFTDGLSSAYRFTAYIDDKNEVLYLSWDDAASDGRFGVYKCADFSVLFTSPALSTYKAYGWAGEGYAMRGEVTDAGISVALQTYALIYRWDDQTLEVWQGGSTPLWSHDVTGDNAGVTIKTVQISLTGKYILVYVNSDELMLYEGA